MSSYIAYTDRQNVREITAEGREVSLLVQELDYPVWLVNVTACGGATDAEIWKRNGAEITSLLAVLSERVP